jgi:hypothetical protein
VEREVADSNHYLTGVIAFTGAALLPPTIIYRSSPFVASPPHNHMITTL